MAVSKKKIAELEKIAYAPYGAIRRPTAEDWNKSYSALRELCEAAPDEWTYPNTLGYLCFYGRHTGGERAYAEARAWFEKGAELGSIESMYKLADMLTDGLGGETDRDRAANLYLKTYWFCRNQFESGVWQCSFADAALRMARAFHEGKLTDRDDTEALGYLLEAEYALERRRQYGQYGDETVAKNIKKLLSECEKPDRETRGQRFYGVGLGRVPEYFLIMNGSRMTVAIEPDDPGLIRLEFRRLGRDGQKPNPVLWTVPPAMRCFMTDFVVLYGKDVLEIRNENPGVPVVCDRYAYDRDNDSHLFYLGDALACRIKGGEYALSMDEFLLTEMRDHPESGSGLTQ